MKLYGSTKVLIPYFDGGMKNWLTLNFKGDVDTRRVHREIRKFCKKTFNKNVSKEWIQKVCLVVNEHDQETLRMKPDHMNQFIEEFIQRVQCNEDEDNSHTEGEATPADEAQAVHG